MILIADSGSTKTDWVCLDYDSQCSQIEAHTIGLNPYHLSDDDIRRALEQELKPQLGDSVICDVYFYGSGVRPEMEARMEGLLREAFPSAQRYHGAYCGRIGQLLDAQNFPESWTRFA